MVELERRGIPTVLFTAQTFVHDAHRSAASFGAHRARTSAR